MCICFFKCVYIRRRDCSFAWFLIDCFPTFEFLFLTCIVCQHCFQCVARCRVVLRELHDTMKNCKRRSIEENK